MAQVIEPNDDFLATARKRFAAAAEDEKHLRDKFCSDLKFAAPDGDGQWDPQVRMQREAAGRPAMSFPRCHTFVQQVANEARQNKPQIKFAPHGDGDKETAEVYEGLARYIQYSSDAQVAYETAIEYSAGGSFGYYRFITDYVEDDDSDEADQDLRVLPVLDPLTIYGILLPACFNRKPTHAFVVEDIPKEEYKLLYPSEKTGDIAGLSWSEAEKQGEGWVGSETVRVAEYWWVEEKKVQGKRRPKRVVKFCKTNGLEILKDSETTWAGSSIPIVPVLGRQMIIEGKAHLYSVVSPQKSAQMLINYSKSRIAETLSTSPISPFMVAEGQINGYEDQWKSLNTTLRPYLMYKTIDNMGKPIPPPTRNTFEPPIQSLSNFVLQEVDDMKATTGIFDASMGAPGNETSGQAIKRRQDQANLTTMHFMDNLIRSYKQGGEVIAEMIPLIYDTPRIIQILGDDEETDSVKINQAHTDAAGQTKTFDMTKGSYKPIVTSGPAFDSKRMESFDTMTQVLQVAPDLIHVIGDIYFKNSDMAGADQLADRFKKMLPPNLQDDGPEQVPPQAQAMIQHLQQELQQHQAMGAQLYAKYQELDFEKKAGIVKNEGLIALEKLKIEASIATAEINTKAQEIHDRQEFTRDVASKLMDHKHEAATNAADAAHEVGLKGMDQVHQQQNTDHQAEIQSEQSAQQAMQDQASQAQDGAEGAQR